MHKTKLRYVSLINFLILISVFSVRAETSADSLVDEIEIWPGAGPGSDTLTIEENILVRSLSGTCSRDWAIESITAPTITPLIPENPNGAAVIICPGGAFVRVVYDVEGMDVGRWLNSIGITAFVLKYRLPNNPHIDKKNVPLQDAQRALRYVRANAETWGLDTSKIGIMGASAGGHAASTLASSYNKEVYTKKDYIDSVSARPDFMLLLYPVISMEPAVTHSTTRDMLLGTSPDQATIDEFSAEKNVTKKFPITYMTRAADDNGVNAENCNRLYKALQDSGIVSDLKIFKNGGHGVGICKAVGSDFESWPLFCNDWLYKNGLTNDAVVISHNAGVSDITLDPAGDFIFDVDTKEYNVVLPGETTAVTIAVTTSNDGATVTGQGKKSVSSDNVTTATIEVTAQDDTTVNTYIINFTVLVGIETVDHGVFKVYPNPSGNSIHIQLNNSMEEVMEVSIYTLQGKIIKRIGPITKGENIIVSDLTSGIYIVELKTSINTLFQKLIVN